MLALADPELDNGPRTEKSATMRMCAVSRAVRPIDELIRFVVSPTGEVVADLKRKLPGRGLWVSASRKAVAEAVRRHHFGRGFKRDVRVAATLADDTEKLLVRGVAEALAMAATAGQVLSGFSKVEAALRARHRLMQVRYFECYFMFPAAVPAVLSSSADRYRTRVWLRDRNVLLAGPASSAACITFDRPSAKSNSSDIRTVTIGIPRDCALFPRFCSANPSSLRIPSTAPSEA